MRLIQQSETNAAALEINFLLVSDTDGFTPVTSISWAAGDLKVKKAGGAFANAAGANPVHTENGVWTYALTTAEVNTAGELLVKVFKTGIREFVRTIEIVGFQPRDATRLGLASLPNAAAEAPGGLYTRGSGAGQINQDANGRADARVTAMEASVLTATAAAVADAVLAEVVADHSSVAGSLAQTLLLVKGLCNGNVRHDLFVYDAGGLLTSCRIRVFPTAADAAAQTNLLATFSVSAVNGANGPTSYQVTQS